MFTKKIDDFLFKHPSLRRIFAFSLCALAWGVISIFLAYFVDHYVLTLLETCTLGGVVGFIVLLLFFFLPPTTNDLVLEDRLSEIDYRLKQLEEKENKYEK